MLLGVSLLRRPTGDGDRRRQVKTSPNVNHPFPRHSMYGIFTYLHSVPHWNWIRNWNWKSPPKKKQKHVIAIAMQFEKWNWIRI